MNAASLINQALRMLMRSRRRAGRRGGINRGGDQSARKLRSLLRFSRFFRRF